MNVIINTAIYLSVIGALLVLAPTRLVSVEESPASELPKASVQIVNATSVPKLSMSVNGKVLYPEFPQGLYTADAPLPELKPRYEVVDSATGLAAEFQAELTPNTHQSLVVIGDFMIPQDPALYLAGVVEKAESDPKRKSTTSAAKSKPNILFLLFDHDLSKEEEPLRYRIINGIMGLSVTIDGLKSGKVVIPPGGVHALYGRKPLETLDFTVDGKSIPVLINQQGSARNAMIIFFRTDNGPAFMRAFENSKRSLEFGDETDPIPSGSPADER